MKQRNKILTGFVLVVLISLSGKAELSAQPYAHSTGIRAGYSSGILYKGFRLHRLQAYEATLYYNQLGLQVSASYLWHFQPFRDRNLIIFTGAGILGSKDGSNYNTGPLLSAGVEYVVRDVPISFALDWQPGLYLLDPFKASWYDLGLCIRYYFK